MNKKRQIKSTGGRGGGARQKTSARILTRKARPLQERDLQENKRVICNNETLVKKPSRKANSKRGRPRSRVVELPPMINVKLDACQIAPVMPMPRCPVAQAVDIRINYHQPVHFKAQSMSIVRSPNTSQEREMNSCAHNNNNNKWPQDLEELVIDWDYLPEGQVIKWLSVPVMPTESSVPLPVARIQEMMAEWVETHENKVQQVLEWLGYSFISTHQVAPPKVVVEAESSSVQVCSQWSSMTEHRESRQPDLNEYIHLEELNNQFKATAVQRSINVPHWYTNLTKSPTPLFNTNR